LRKAELRLLLRPKEKYGKKKKPFARQNAFSCSTRLLTEMQRTQSVWLHFRAFAFNVSPGIL